MNKTLQKLILLCLCFFLAFSSLTGCSSKKSSKKKSTGKKSSQTVTESSTYSNSSDGLIDDEESDDDWTDPEDGEGEEELTVYPAKFFNGSAPVINTYRGAGSVLYELYTYMPYKNKMNMFTEREAQEQFNRMQQIGISLVRTDYNTYMNYVAETGSWDFENTDYMKAFIKEGLEMKKRNIDIAIVPGWSHHALVDDTSSIDSKQLYVQPEVYDENGKYLIGDDMYYSYKEGNKFNAAGKVMTKAEWKQAMNAGFAATTANWTKWMKDSILTLRAKGLTNLNTIIMFTEPCKVFWTAEKRLHHYECYVQSCKAMDSMLKSVGLRSQFKLVGPNIAYDQGGGTVKDGIAVDYSFKKLKDPANSYSEGLAYMLENAAEYLDVFSVHTYYKSNDPTKDVYYDLAKQYSSDWMSTMKRYATGKEFWVDEWAVGESDRAQAYHDSPYLGTQMAISTIAMQEQGISNSVYWSLYNQQWPNNINTGGEFTNGVQMCGLANSLQLSTIPSTQYYAFALLSRFYSGMNRVYKSSYEEMVGVYYAMLGNQKGGVTITAVNNNSEAVKAEISLEKSLNGATLYRHVYNPNTMKKNAVTQVVPADRAYRPVNGKLVDILEPGCVAIYTTEKLN